MLVGSRVLSSFMRFSVSKVPDKRLHGFRIGAMCLFFPGGGGVGVCVDYPIGIFHSYGRVTTLGFGAFRLRPP